jgi:hypothetical protein
MAADPKSAALQEAERRTEPVVFDNLGEAKLTRSGAMLRAAFFLGFALGAAAQMLKSWRITYRERGPEFFWQEIDLSVVI